MKTKLLSILLAFAMMISMLAACNNEPVDPAEKPDDQQQVENQGNEGEEVISDVLNLVVDGVSDYVIVRGETRTFRKLPLQLNCRATSNRSAVWKFPS